jgi:hypothetical protein
LFLTVLEAANFKIMERADSVSGEGPFPRLWVAFFLCLHMAERMCVLVSFLSLWPYTQENQLTEGKIYFGSQLQIFSPCPAGTIAFRPVVRQA